MSQPPRITSRHNPHVKNAVALRSSRERRSRRRHIIDGAREIQRAIEAGIHCVEAFVCEELVDSREAAAALDALRGSGAELHTVSPAVYAKLAFGDRDDGIVVVAETPNRRLTDLKLPDRPLVAVLEGIEKPGNLGAILRSADAAGVHAVIVADGHTDLFNPNTIRASLGTVFRANVVEATSADAITWLRDRGLAILATRPDAELLYSDVNLARSVAIVLGSEAAGLSDVWSGTSVETIRLPMHGLADSLNVSTTAAVLFYEALRQRRDSGR
jgi:TrmH family RNA methyltransferase